MKVFVLIASLFLSSLAFATASESCYSLHKSSGSRIGGLICHYQDFDASDAVNRSNLRKVYSRAVNKCNRNKACRYIMNDEGWKVCKKRSATSRCK